jgi:hypothetical protein
MKHYLPTSIVTVLLLGFASAQAQIGSNWQQYTPSKSISADTGYYYNNSGGVETFRIPSPCNRSEIHLGPTYTSGSRQFEGYVNCRSGSDQNAIHQVMFYQGPPGDAQQIRIYNSSGGTLKVLQNQVQVGTGCYGVYERVNVLHYLSTGSVEVWFNGSKKSTYNVGPNANGFYFKYGCYTHPENNPQIQWKSIRTWQK